MNAKVCWKYKQTFKHLVVVGSLGRDYRPKLSDYRPKLTTDYRPKLSDYRPKLTDNRLQTKAD